MINFIKRLFGVHSPSKSLHNDKMQTSNGWYMNVRKQKEEVGSCDTCIHYGKLNPCAECNATGVHWDGGKCITCARHKKPEHRIYCWECMWGGSCPPEEELDHYVNKEELQWNG